MIAYPDDDYCLMKYASWYGQLSHLLLERGPPLTRKKDKQPRKRRYDKPTSRKAIRQRAIKELQDPDLTPAPKESKRIVWVPILNLSWD